MYCRILESGPNCFRRLRVASGLIRLSFRPAINVKWKVSGMANKSMRIAIAGGGPSGLTLASILGREASNKEAFDITIFERGAADRDQGSGWDVDEAGQAALIRAGVELKSIQRPDSDRQRSYRVDDMDQPIAAFGLPSSISKLGSIKEQLGLLASPSLETERKKMVDGLTNALSSNTKIFMRPTFPVWSRTMMDPSRSLAEMDPRSTGASTWSSTLPVPVHRFALLALLMRWRLVTRAPVTCKARLIYRSRLLTPG